MAGVQIIDVPGQGEIEFPADMADDQIAAAIKRIQLSPMQKRMGLGKQGDTMGDIHRARNNLIYEAGGKLTDLTGSPALGAAANVITDISTDPLTYAGGAFGKALAPVAQAGARRTMQSALKPTWNDLRTGKAAQAIETMLKDGFNADAGGVEAMKTKIGQLNDEIATSLENHPGVVEPHKVAERVKDLAEKFKMQVTPQSDVASIREAMNEFLNHPLLRDSAEIPVKTAQQLKQGTYRALGSKSYGELKGAEVEAQKALARGLKEEISSAVPGVAAKNAKESELINAANIAERRSMLQDNNNLGGLVWLAHDPVAALGYLADKSAWAKSIIARFLYKNAAAMPAEGAATGGGIGSLLEQQGQK